MSLCPAEIRPVREGLLRVGFREDRLRSDVPLPTGTGRVPLLAFADQPFDSRTASVAVLQGQQFTDSDIMALRPLGAPIVFACLAGHFQLWVQAADGPRFHCRLNPRELVGFFNQHRAELAPAAIYRAKVWGRIEKSFQLEFVDAGFLPLVEEEAGQKLTALLERVVAGTKRHLGWRAVSDADGRWLLQSTFWLLAAKILQDKAVPSFMRLDLSDLEGVYERLARHYNGASPRPVKVGGAHRHEALLTAAQEIKTFGHCGAVSTEALAYLYESALIDRAIRQKLGTHSTPTWLVDYIVGRLRPWVEQGIPVDDRRVFEPACGHAGFLIAAMRLLSELLPSGWRQPRRDYLRERLHGLEIDPFALEVARLSLTLADVPNPNGWALTEANMFKADLLERGVRDATIVLGNPPFEDFAAKERAAGWLPNKGVETFRRVVEHLPSGGVFGFVLPQTFLHSKQATAVRQLLLRDYEIAEISLFADKVFRYGEPESAVLIGRRLAQGASRGLAIRYQSVRERQIAEFSRTYRPGSEVEVGAERFACATNASLLLPELDEVWKALVALPHLEAVADVGQGFSHKGDSDPTLPPGTIKESYVPCKGLARGFAGWDEQQQTHQLPRSVWLNLDPQTILARRSGTLVGTPQVLLNYARVSRGAWRLKALIDVTGYPVTSDFLVVRPKLSGLSLSLLWAICNSPVANAYAYCHSIKRHVLAGDMRRMPVPDLTKHDLSAVEQAVADYLAVAKAAPSSVGHGPRTQQGKADSRQIEMPLAGAAPALGYSLLEPSTEHLKFLHWRIDAEVLRLYALPAALERKVLDLFSGIRRRGVPFEQTEYFPKGFTELHRLSDLLAATVDWPKTNRRRAKLMDLEDEGRLTPDQAAELKHLQRLADASVSLAQPSSPSEIDRAVKNLKRRGLWTE